MLKKITIPLAIIVLLSGIGYYLYTRNSVVLFAAGKMLDRQTFENEEILGAKIHFESIQKGWIKHPLKGQMDEIWSEKIGKRGMNYFFVGTPRSIFSQYSERFNPKSKLYQAWFGCYIILDEEGLAYGFENGNPIWEKFIQLAIEDQNAWLKTYRVSNPQTKITEMLEEPTVININDHEAYLSFWQGESQSDLNESGSLSEDLNQILGVPKKESWNKMVKSHHPVILKGFFIIWRESPYPATFCCYGCGVEFKTLEGKIVENFSKIKDDLLDMARGIKIKPI